MLPKKSVDSVYITPKHLSKKPQNDVFLFDITLIKFMSLSNFYLPTFYKLI